MNCKAGDVIRYRDCDGAMKEGIVEHSGEVYCVAFHYSLAINYDDVVSKYNEKTFDKVLNKLNLL